MNQNDITDKRTIKEFKYNFSKYKKSDAKKELLNNLNNKINRCYWELNIYVLDIMLNYGKY